MVWEKIGNFQKNKNQTTTIIENIINNQCYPFVYILIIIIMTYLLFIYILVLLLFLYFPFR